MNAKKLIWGALLGASTLANASPVQWEWTSSVWQPGGAPVAGPITGKFIVNGDLLAGEPVTELLSFDFVINGRAFGLADVTPWFEADRYTIGLGDRNLTPGTDDFFISVSPLTRISDGVIQGHVYSALYTMEGFSGIYTGGSDQVVVRTVLPEPGTYAMFGLGLAAMGLAARRVKTTS